MVLGKPRRALCRSFAPLLSDTCKLATWQQPEVVILGAFWSGGCAAPHACGWGGSGHQIVDSGWPGQSLPFSSASLARRPPTPPGRSPRLYSQVQAWAVGRRM